MIRRRFAHEVAALRKVNPLFTAPIVDADTEADEPWLATTFIDGPSLDDWVTGHGPLAPGAVLTLRHFRFDDGGASTYGGQAAYFNSLRMAIYTALAGTALTFLAAYLFEKLRPMPAARRAGYFLAVCVGVHLFLR